MQLCTLMWVGEDAEFVCQDAIRMLMSCSPGLIPPIINTGKVDAT